MLMIWAERCVGRLSCEMADGSPRPSFTGQLQKNIQHRYEVNIAYRVEQAG